ncbi:MAG TPA: S8 family serine peptidase [Bacteroidales bacterium]|nr:S8 family serine peptidase [Bacteroidales bacterium]
MGLTAIKKLLFLKSGIALCLIIIAVYETAAQQRVAPDIYLIRFANKENNAYDINRPHEFLSTRAIDRRSKQNINLEESDLPVTLRYIDSLKSTGFNIINVSKWLNAVSVKISDTTLFRKLKGISFVQPYYAHTTLSMGNTKRTPKEPDIIESRLKSERMDYGLSTGQIAMHHGEYLHQKGFQGQGITIAILDGGFQDVRDFTSLQNLWFEQRVIATCDFADHTGNTFYGHLHGSNVLSVMAGISEGKFVGTAPKANYILVHSENSSIYDFQPYEYPVEEFDWVVAAEYADSIGADIINSSLGYSEFTDPLLSYTYEDMDGQTAISSIGANIAASKGILVVVSAGNEGDSYWKYITAPADAENIITVGAIDQFGARASFSSTGPTADGRIKPDVVAVGKGTLLQTSKNIFNPANGTSFSAPIISGLAACLWQAVPNATNLQIIDAIKRSSSQFQNPDTMYGYGIPNFKKALYLLNPAIFPITGVLTAYPNPFSSAFTLEFSAMPKTSSVLQIFDIIGRMVYENKVTTYTDIPNDLIIEELSPHPKGIYSIRILSGETELQTRVLKQ